MATQNPFSCSLLSSSNPHSNAQTLFFGDMRGQTQNGETAGRGHHLSRGTIVLDSGPWMSPIGWDQRDGIAKLPSEGVTQIHTSCYPVAVWMHNDYSAIPFPTLWVTVAFLALASAPRPPWTDGPWWWQNLDCLHMHKP